ncbi:MAG TPA: hypothetical protein VGH37_09405 [Candidatus Acidoferrum sp.]
MGIPSATIVLLFAANDLFFGGGMGIPSTTGLLARYPFLGGGIGMPSNTWVALSTQELPWID